MKSPIVLAAPTEYETVWVGSIMVQNDLWRPSETLAKNERMWYGVPTGVYVHTQRGNVAIGLSSGTMHYSEDSSRTWLRTLDFADAEGVQFGHIFENGNILWGTSTKLYLSVDGLQTYSEVVPKNPDGTDFVPHTPANASYPGQHFYSIQVDSSWTINGTEVLAWGNYANVFSGAAPSIVWYSVDNGVTVKVAYMFGQNPYHRDDGTAGGGTSGTLLGDSDNSLFCRHIHSVAYNPTEDAWYVATGDHDRGGTTYECHWLKGTYDADLDTWSWTLLTSASQSTRYKAAGVSFRDGDLYFASDATSGGGETGIFKCGPADLLSPELHTKLYDWEYETGKMLLHGTTLVTGVAPAVHDGSTLLLISNDLGATWGLYDLTGVGERSSMRFHPPNSEGWFRVDLRLPPWGLDPGEVMFFKPRVF